MDAGLDAAICQGLLERPPRAAFRKNDHGQVVGRLARAVRRERHLDPGGAVERRPVLLNEAPAGCVVLREPPQLDEPDRRADLVEAVVEAVLDHVVAVRVAAVTVPRQRRHPVRAQQADALGERVVVRDEHPALARWQVLVREEAEAADVAERPARLPLPACAERVRSVFDHGEPMAVRELEDRFDVAGMAAVMEDDDRARRRRDRSLDVVDVEVQVVRPADVAEHRPRPNVHDRVGGGDEVE